MLNNDRVEPGALIGGHVRQTRAMCSGGAGEPVVLCVQDSTELSTAHELPVTNLQEALFIVECHRQRWRIEEWRRAQKTDCRLKSSPPRDVDAFRRPAAISAVIAVRLLQLRDLGEDEQADNPAKLQQVVSDPLVLQVVARLAKVDDPTTLTPRQFLHTLARQGGWLARKHDGRPGWQTLRHGRQKVHAYADGIRLLHPT